MYDDGQVPAAVMWQQNFLQPGLNNYRQAQQGDVGAEAQPDLTAEFLDDACVIVDDPKVALTAEVCNRGAKPVGAGMPTAFFLGEPKDGVVLCVALTQDALVPEQCVKVSCEYAGPLMGDISVEANNDGMGGKTTLECIATNNGDLLTPVMCSP